jgi:hypothetical protein
MADRLDAATLGKWRKTLAEWRARLSAAASDELYLGLRRMKSELLLADPAIDFFSILCIDNPYVHGSEAVHEIRHRNEDTATPGGRLLALDGLRPELERPREFPAIYEFEKPEDASRDGFVDHLPSRVGRQRRRSFYGLAATPFDVESPLCSRK